MTWVLLLPVYLKVYGYISIFSTRFSKGDNFHDFLLVCFPGGNSGPPKGANSFL